MKMEAVVQERASLEGELASLQSQINAIQMAKRILAGKSTAI